MLVFLHSASSREAGPSAGQRTLLSREHYDQRSALFFYLLSPSATREVFSSLNFFFDHEAFFLSRTFFFFSPSAPSSGLSFRAAGKDLPVLLWKQFDLGILAVANSTCFPLRPRDGGRMFLFLHFSRWSFFITFFLEHSLVPRSFLESEPSTPFFFHSPSTFSGPWRFLMWNTPISLCQPPISALLSWCPTFFLLRGFFFFWTSSSRSFLLLRASFFDTRNELYFSPHLSRGFFLSLLFF